MRILHLLAGRAEGGAEAFFERLCVALHRRGVQQEAVIRPHPQRVSRLQAEGIPVSTAPYQRYMDWRTPRIIQAAARRLAPSVVLSWMSRATLHSPSLDATHVARLGGYYDIKYYQRCDYLIANTPPLQQWLRQQGWPAERVLYLPNFVEAPQPGAPLPDGLTKPADKPLLLALGRLHRQKGFDTLLRAMTRLDAHLWLAGRGSEEGALRQLAVQLEVQERVRFLGWQAQPSALYQAADAFVCPSREETLGNVILEAWAHSRPVISTATAGPSYYVCPEVDGLIVPVDDPVALATAVGRVLRDASLAKALSVAGYARYQADFTEVAVVDQYQYVLQSLRS